jgi:hypothetical protein
MLSFEDLDELIHVVSIADAKEAVQSRNQRNPTVDMGTSATLAEQGKRLEEMRDKVANLRKNEKLLDDEGLKLLRIEDELKVAEAELLNVEDSADAAEKSCDIAKFKRLRNEKTMCLNRQDIYNGFINTLKDQIAAAEHKNEVEGFNEAAKSTVNEDELLDVIKYSKEAVRTQNQGKPPSTLGRAPGWLRKSSVWRR